MPNETITGTNVDPQIKPENTQLSTPPQTHRSTPPRNVGRITQWAAVALSVIALLLGIVANLRVSMIQGGISRSASELASALSSDGTSASSGSDTKAMKKTGKKIEVKTVEYTAAEGSVLEGDYAPYDSVNFHLKLVKLEVTGTKATLTSELTNNGTESDSWSFSATVFQNGQKRVSESSALTVRFRPVTRQPSPRSSTSRMPPSRSALKSNCRMTKNSKSSTVHRTKGKRESVSLRTSLTACTTTQKKAVSMSPIDLGT